MRSEDGNIIHECLNGDSASFGLLVDKYKASIYALAYSKLRNFHDAEDVTQEVFIKAYKSLHTLRRWDSFLVWIRSMTINFCRDKIKTSSRRPDKEFIEEQSISSIEKTSSEAYKKEQWLASHKETLDLLEEALKTLPESYRQILTLHYLGGMSGEQISEFLSISHANVRQRLSRAREQLKEEMIAMMNQTFQQQKLSASFTFRIVELVKKIKINPISEAKNLPWGLSLGAGVILAVLMLGQHIIISLPDIAMGLPLPSDTKILKLGEIPVEAVKVSTIASIADKVDGKGLAPDPKGQENALFMAPQAEGKWTWKANMPTARAQFATAVANGKIYAFGGIIDINLNITATVEEYDPVENKWTKKSNMPKAKMTNYSASAVDGLIYLVGGSDLDRIGNTVDVYDPIKDNWKAKSDMPTPRMNFCTEVVKGKIYAIGGVGAGAANFAKSISAVEEYDPVKDTWTKKSDMTKPRDSFSAATFNNKIYIFGGEVLVGVNQFGPPVPEVLEYDPMTDKWTQKSDMPTPRIGAASVLVDDKIYTIGGFIMENGFYKDFSIVEIYDPVNDTWSDGADIQEIKDFHCCNLVNGKIYVIGGCSGIAILSSVEEFDTGFISKSVDPSGKLPQTWGTLKAK